jgi:glycosyltransferase involved in cell wall biosynthesis
MTISEIVHIASTCCQKVIVVDDGSQDNTYQIIKELDLPNVTIIKNKKNIGKSNAVKRALKQVNTNFVLLLDADLIGLKKVHIQELKNNINENILMVVGLRDRMGSIGKYIMKFLPKIGGERIIKTSIIKSCCNNSLWKEYNMELILNSLVKKSGKCKYIFLEGVNHIPRVKKRGFKGALNLIRMFSTYTIIGTYLHFSSKKH